jgi:hypothetical protein
VVVTALVLAVALGYFAVGVVRLVEACSDQTCDVVAGVAGMLLWGLAAGAVVLGACVLFLRSWARPLVFRLLIVVFSAALVAATPKEALWWAECNSHAAWASLAGGVAAATVDTAEPRLTFTHRQTLVGCG